MSHSLSEIRRRIHDKSQEYFTFAYGRRDRSEWRMFYGATDALLDASMAAAAFGNSLNGDSGTDLLVCYGFLQALYIQQDAVQTLSSSVGLKWKPNDDEVIRKIRDIRNRLTGHPALAGETSMPKRLSSAIISYDRISPNGFQGFIYFEDEGERIDVDVATMLQSNEERLELQMKRIETKIDQKEKLFRSEQAKKPLCELFGVGFGYLVEKLNCDLNDVGAVVQAKTHVRMIRKIIQDVCKNLSSRGFASNETEYRLEHISMALDFVEVILHKKKHSRADQIKFNLLMDGFQKNLDVLQRMFQEIDALLITPIS